MPITPTKPRAPKVYLVKNQHGHRLVRAFTPAGAIKHVIGTSYTAAIATQDELITALARGAKVEDAGETSAQQEELDV